MTAALQRSPLDARRGVVRLHPEVLELLNVRPWEPLAIEGTRATAALGAQAPPSTDRWSILMDDITCANAGVQPGEKVRVGRAGVAPAGEVVITGKGTGHVDPFALRFSLLGKVVRTGDKVSMLPQDFTRPESGVDLETLVRYLNTNLGESWKAAVLDVANTAPEGLVRITMETVVLWNDPSGEVAAGTDNSATPIEGAAGAAPTFDDLPGHENALERLRELFDLGFHHRDLLDKLGSAPRMGVLISGPPGSGKVVMVRAVAAALGARIVHRWGPALARVTPDAAAESLRSAVAEVRGGGPAILLIEDVDAIASRDEPGPLLSVLLEEARALVGGAGVVCTTAHPEATSPELRRPGILDAEIEISLPNAEQRRRILEVSTRRLPLAADVALETVAARTPGFVAADLVALCREASLRAAQRNLVTSSTTPEVAQVDFEAALEVTRPSSMEGLSVQVGDVHLQDVGDMEATKKELEEAIVWPLRYPDTFDRMGVAPARGVLLYGPPVAARPSLCVPSPTMRAPTSCR
jgi:transitional endoplasmic reticulum ATPase